MHSATKIGTAERARYPQRAGRFEARSQTDRPGPIWHDAPTIGHVPAIDGLRAIAVLAVLVYHANPRWLPGGLIGVDIFFAISGFVVPASILWRRFDGPIDALGFFYVRRTYRILPALLCMLVATSVLVVLFVPRSWLGDGITQTALAAFVGVSNFVLYGLEGDYFSPKSVFNPFLHTWSLAVEEQFYIVFSLLMFALTLRREAWARKVALGFVSTLTIGSLVMAWLVSASAPSYAFYMLPPRFWELGVGVLGYLAFRSLAPRLSAMPPWVSAILASVAGLGLIVPLAIGSTKTIAYPAPTVLPSVLATVVLMLLTAARPASAATRVLSLRPLRYVGLISYSLYLWHWPIFVLMRWTTGFQTPLQIAVGLVLSVGLAVASYHLVETPLRTRVASSQVPRATAIGRVGVAVALASLLVFGSSKAYDTLSLSVTANAAVWFPYKLDKRLEKDCPVARSQQTFADGSEVSYTPHCRTNLSQRTLFVVGDSHALALVRMLHGFAATTGMKVKVFARTSCTFVIAREPPQDWCRAFADAVLALLDKEATRDDVVLFAGRRMPRFVEPDGTMEEPVPTLSSRDLAQISSAFERDLAALLARGTSVVVEAPQPVFKTIPFRCSDWFNHANPDCGREAGVPRRLFEEGRGPLLSVMHQEAATHPNMTIWDPSDLICDVAVCTIWHDGKPMYFDGDHVSGFADDRMLPGFRQLVLHRLGAS